MTQSAPSLDVKGYAVMAPGQPLVPFTFERRRPRPEDVVVDILFCGVCHSDIHTARGEWGESEYPVVPGHEIVGRVSQKGASAGRFNVGDLVGVGCYVDSCRVCPSCRSGLEPYCDDGPLWTYNATDPQGHRTFGGYSSRIVVDEKYVLKIPQGMDPAQAAPLLCAGITTWSPLKHWGVKPGMSVGVAGLGGLGHMAVKLIAALGARPVVISRSGKKKSDALSLGAVEYYEEATLPAHKKSLDLILDTVSAPHDVDRLLGTLKREGTLVMLGVSPESLSFDAFSLIGGRRSLAGSLIGGLREIQDMLDFCGRQGVHPEVEVIPVAHVNAAYDRVVSGDVKFRFVLDMATL